MDLQQALAQLDTIHAHVSRTETFRGYRPATVASQGVLALLAAAGQAFWLPNPGAQVGLYLQVWIGVAAVAVTIVSLDLAIDCLRTPTQFARRQTWLAIEQFLPCVAAGAALTWALSYASPQSLPLLPGLWAIVFSLGVFSASRQLPKSIVLIGAYYFAAGLAALLLARGEHAFSPWAMAGTFGVGQLLTALVLRLHRDS